MGKRRMVWAVALVVLMTSLLPLGAGAQVRRDTLRWGSTGTDVRVAQGVLSQWGYYTGAVDGVYGPTTYGAIVDFQARNGLPADGVVGPATWRAMGENVADVPTGAAGAAAGVAGRADDEDLLARVVSAEAMGEPYEGQVAVAAVILNRVSDPRFPNTLPGVVYQEWAFESVDHGTIYQPPTASAARAARDALNGWDPTGGAVFFWNPYKPVSEWIWSRPITTQIGDHVFAD